MEEIFNAMDLDKTMKPLTDKDIETLTDEYFRSKVDMLHHVRLKAEADGKYDDDEYPHHDPLYLAGLLINFAEKHSDIAEGAGMWLKDCGYTYDKDSHTFRDFVNEVILVEQKALALAQTPEFRGLRSLPNIAPQVFSPSTTPTVPQQPPVRPVITLGQALKKYIEAKASSWKPSSAKDIPRDVEEFVKIVGNKPVDALTTDHAREFMRTIANLPKNWKKDKTLAGKTYATLAKMRFPPERLPMPTTLENKAVNVKSFLTS